MYQPNFSANTELTLENTDPEVPNVRMHTDSL